MSVKMQTYSQLRLYITCPIENRIKHHFSTEIIEISRTDGDQLGAGKKTETVLWIAFSRSHVANLKTTNNILYVIYQSLLFYQRYVHIEWNRVWLFNPLFIFSNFFPQNPHFFLYYTRRKNEFYKLLNPNLAYLSIVITI